MLIACPAPFGSPCGKCRVRLATVIARAAVDPATAARVDTTLATSYFYHNFSGFIKAQISRVNR